MKIKNLNEIVKIDERFKNSINLQLDLNKTDKALGYIPTKSSISILNNYFLNVINNRDKASILIGPYGKGKSHLLLVLLTILRLERNDINEVLINKIIKSFQDIDNEAAKSIKEIWSIKKKYLPIIVSSTQGDLNQAFLVGLNEALTNANLNDVVPDTYYTEALKIIKKWKESYYDTYEKFLNRLQYEKIAINDFQVKLKLCDKSALELFKKVYPELTSGSHFNPLINTEVLRLYKNINDIICDEYDYSGMYIVFDEFSKFIESHDKSTVANDMKILQDICELSSDSVKNQIHITLVTHKSIKEYSNVLSNDIINSFTGIEGRITENYFVTSSKNNYELLKNAIKKDDKKLDQINRESGIFSQDVVERYYNIPTFKSMFLYNDFDEVVFRGCFPLSPVSAYVLLNISERVAQNERTLFTFVSKNEPFSMANYIQKHERKDPWIIGVYLIYDYFKSIFKKDITNVFIHNEWLKAEYTLTNVSDSKSKKMIKTLALFNIINKFDEMPPNTKVLSLATGMINEGAEVLRFLENKQLIYKKSSTDYYVFKSRIGADIKAEINKERVIIGDNIDLCQSLTRAIDNEYILPKKFNQKFSMTRFFSTKYMLYNDFLQLSKAEYLFSEKFADGYIISLICEQDEILKEVSCIEQKLQELDDERIIVLVPKNYYEIKKYVRDYIIIQKMKENNEFMNDNKVLINELELYEEDIIYDIERYLDCSFNAERGDCTVVSYYKQSSKIEKNDNINRIVSKICDNYFSLTPVINNEMINRRNITSPPIKKARKAIIEFILNNNLEKSFYYGKTNPEATIFRAVLVNTNVLSGKPEASMKEILMHINSFIDSCEESKKNFTFIFNVLQSAPYGMRMGVIPIILAYVLTIRNDNIIIYLKNKEEELSYETIINICENPYDYFLYVEKGTNEKREYLERLMKLFGLFGTYKPNKIKISHVVLEMQRWLKSLPQITRSFKNDTSITRSKLQINSIVQFKTSLQLPDINPYELIYKKIPRIFGKIDLKGVFEDITYVKHILDLHLNNYIDILLNETKSVFAGNKEDNLASILHDWYEDQSQSAKQGLYSDQISGLLNYICDLNTYDETVILKRLAKIVMGIHIENWNDESKDKFISSLITIRMEIESIKDKNIPNEGKYKLTFIDSNNKEVVKYYEGISENTGYLLRNVISEALDEFGESISMNDKVAVLVEMLEKVLR